MRFINRGFTIRYEPGPSRAETENRVSWRDADGNEQAAVIGDQYPLVLDGYRFYTSFNKGFAPLLEWRPRQGEPLVGDVHLPGYPGHALRQSLEWTPPGASDPVWLLLQFDEVILDPQRESWFRPPREHQLLVRSGELRQELQPGDAVDLPEGRLTYLGLRSWMGYTVSYDWTRPWILAACLLAVLSLGWHLWVRFVQRPWLQP